MLNSKVIKVLLIEDYAGDARLICDMLAEAPQTSFDLKHVDKLATGLARLSAEEVDVILVDLMLPDSAGLATFERVHEHAPHVPVVVLTGIDDETVGIKAVQEGAQDYLVKGEVNSGLLARALLYAIERKRATEALNRSERKYRHLVENLREGVWGIDRNAHTTFVNARMAEMLGYTEEEMLGKHLFSFMDERGIELCQSYLARREQGIREQHDFELICKDGRRVYTSMATAPINDEAGNYSGAIAGVQDVTARKRAKEALRESEERYRTVANFTYGWEYWRDPEGVFLYISPSCERITGYHAAEFQTESELLERIIHEADRARFIEHLRDKNKHTASVLEFRIVTRAGEERWIEHTCRAVYDADGRYLGERASNRDVTARKRAEQELQQQAYRLAMLNRASQMFNSTLDLNQVLVTVLEEIRRVLDAVGASIWLIEPETNEIVCQQSSGLGHETVRGWRLKLGEGIVGWTAAHGESVVLADTYTDARHFAGVEQKLNLPLHSILSVPLRIKEKVNGVVQVVGQAKGCFAAKDLAVLEPLAATAASAIENAQLYTTLKQQQEQLRALSNILAETEDAERRQLARELHDQVGQNLSVLSLNLNIAKLQMPETAPEVVHSCLENSMSLVREVARRARDVMVDLRAPVLDDYGLAAALKWYSERFTAWSGVEVAVHSATDTLRLNAMMENTLFHIAREALANVAKHAQAAQVVITVEITEKNVRLMIVDDGIGFDSAIPPRRHNDDREGWGLLSMSERAAALGGTCRCISHSGQGTQVIVEVPR